VLVTILGIAAGTGIYYAGFYAYNDLYNPVQDNARALVSMRYDLDRIQAEVGGLARSQHDDLARLSQQVTDHAGRLGAVEGQVALFDDSETKIGDQIGDLGAKVDADLGAVRGDLDSLRGEIQASAESAATYQSDVDSRIAALENDRIVALESEVAALTADLNEATDALDTRVLAAEEEGANVQQTATDMQLTAAAISMQQWALWARLQLERGDLVALRGALQGLQSQIDAYRALPGMDAAALDAINATLDQAIGNVDLNPFLVADNLDALWSQVTALSNAIVLPLPEATPTPAG